jgi:hypothetical protein
LYRCPFDTSDNLFKFGFGFGVSWFRGLRIACGDSRTVHGEIFTSLGRSFSLSMGSAPEVVLVSVLAVVCLPTHSACLKIGGLCSRRFGGSFRSQDFVVEVFIFLFRLYLCQSLLMWVFWASLFRKATAQVLQVYGCVWLTSVVAESMIAEKRVLW